VACTYRLVGPGRRLLAAPAHPDVDTDFANQLHTYGIYGPRDENAWLAKLICKWLTTRVDGVLSSVAPVRRLHQVSIERK
jgi:hypothetical protein